MKPVQVFLTGHTSHSSTVTHGQTDLTEVAEVTGDSVWQILYCNQRLQQKLILSVFRSFRSSNMNILHKIKAQLTQALTSCMSPLLYTHNLRSQGAGLRYTKSSY